MVLVVGKAASWKRHAQRRAGARLASSHPWQSQPYGTALFVRMLQRHQLSARGSLLGAPTKPRPSVPIQGHMGASRIFTHSLLSRSRSAGRQAALVVRLLVSRCGCAAGQGTERHARAVRLMMQPASCAPAAPRAQAQQPMYGGNGSCGRLGPGGSASHRAWRALERAPDTMTGILMRHRPVPTSISSSMRAPPV